MYFLADRCRGNGPKAQWAGLLQSDSQVSNISKQFLPPHMFLFSSYQKESKVKSSSPSCFRLFFSPIVGHETVAMLHSTLIVIISTTLSDPSLSSSLSGTKPLQRQQRVLRLANEEITLGRKRCWRCRRRMNQRCGGLQQPTFDLSAVPQSQSRRGSSSSRGHGLLLERQCPRDCRGDSVDVSD